ncbi:MAG: hypothetical protein DMF79_00295 [Acidobacteria bacterium]|nr:MAG: hypothetical protein DMF79_00295 [Acidobacteriota bacterium]
MKATWQGTVLAESEETVVVEGNHYCPAEAVSKEHLRASETRTTCAWKGLASYFDVIVGDKVNRDAAWVYPEPTDAAQMIRGRIAFWKGVSVEP